MKGIELTISTIILIILGLIILIAFVVLLGTGNTQINIAVTREALRNCCGDRSIWDCKTTSIDSVDCRVPWKAETMKLRQLMTDANVTESNLNIFCFCPTS